ncbi:hypothetical protein [Streptomyces sp. NPDC048155]
MAPRSGGYVWTSPMCGAADPAPATGAGRPRYRGGGAAVAKPPRPSAPR